MYLLLLLFLGSWIGQFFTELAQFRSEQASHNQGFEWGKYLTVFFSSTFENWQSEWLQLVFQAVLLLGAKHLIFRVDAEDLERLEAKVDQITRVLVSPRVEDGPAGGAHESEPLNDPDDDQEVGLGQMSETETRVAETELIPKTVEDLRGLTRSDNDQVEAAAEGTPDLWIDLNEYWPRWRNRWKWSVVVAVWATATLFAFNGAFDSFGPQEWVVGILISVIGSGVFIGTLANFAVALIPRTTPKPRGLTDHVTPSGPQA